MCSAKQLRNTDRYVNSQLYPKIHYPEVYILEGGYYQYFRECQGRCEPRDYICMNHPAFAEQRKEEMEQLRRNAKSNRTKPHSYGESKGGLVDELRQPNRNTAPVAGSSQLFAAGNAARTRRNGILATLDEDPSHIMQSDDDDTDIGDSPCPPPTKGVGLKKLGRARALTRVETAPSRVHLGF